MKDELDKLSLEELQDKFKSLEIKYNEDIFNDKDKIVFYCSKTRGFSRMKVNNQVASNPIGFYESSTNFCKLPYVV